MEKIVQQKKVIFWLLKVWEDNGQQPTWVTVSRQWPEETQEAIAAFHNWHEAEEQMLVAKKIQEDTARQVSLCNLQRRRRLYSQTNYTLEEYISGLIRLMEFLKIDRLPSMREIQEHHAELGIPGPTAYQKKLITKENWMPYIRRYKASTPTERPQILQEMERELEMQHRTMWEEKKFGEKYYNAREKSLRDLYELYQFYNCIPTKVQINEYIKTRNRSISCPTALCNNLGPMGGWSEILTDYIAQREVEKLFQTREALKSQKVRRLDALIKRLLRVASEAEKLEWKSVLQQIRHARSVKPAEFEFELDGRQYVARIRPKG